MWKGTWWKSNYLQSPKLLSCFANGYTMFYIQIMDAYDLHLLFSFNINHWHYFAFTFMYISISFSKQKIRSRIGIKAKRTLIKKHLHKYRMWPDVIVVQVKVKVLWVLVCYQWATANSTVSHGYCGGKCILRP